MAASPERRDEPQWFNEVAAIPANVSYLRRAVVAFAAENGADAQTQGDIALAASEAITNTVIHAYVDMSPGTVSLRASVADTRLRVIISDAGCGMKPRPDSPGLGLGMPTIAHLAASVSIGPGVDGLGTVVSLEFTLP